MKPPNPARTTSNVWWGITAAAVLVIFLPGIIGLEGFNGGFAVSFVGIFLLIIGVITAIIYMRRASALDSIFSGKDLLAHWTYPRDEWIEYANQEHKREKTSKTTLFWVIAGTCLIVGIGFFLFDHKAGVVVLLAMLALIAIMAFTAWFTAWYNYRQNLKYLGETYITSNAVYLNRQLHIWNSLDSRLQSVQIIGNSRSYLEFKYAAPTRTGVQEYTANVPIPHGKSGEAKKILEKFATGKK